MSTSNTLASSADSPSSRIDVDELVDYLETAPIRLAVFGEFSAGKTTVLNALIGEEILSVAVEPTTAVPTRVRYGREFNIFVHRTDGASLPLFEDDPPFWTRFVGRRDMLSTLRRERASLQDFLRTWTKEGEQADQVERVEIQLPLDWLKEGLELVDTPGANNEFTRHHSFTEQEARTADIALLLMDARQGGGKRTEFEFMNDVQRQVPRCIVAPNKMDLVDADEREEFVEYIREEALPQHWDGAVTPPVTGISALAALHPDQHDEPDLVAAFDDLKSQLETIATEQRGPLLLARRDSPVKQLFAEAKALEGEEKYDRAHRIYFDVLDILDAADMDPKPAHEGIQRCETHLSTQVETLDRLNERYNEIAEEYEGDPDKRLEALKALKADKTELAIDDEKLNAEIQTLQNRIDKRDEARLRVEAIVEETKQFRSNGNLIKAASRAGQLVHHAGTAELSENRLEQLHDFLKKQVQDRDEWAREKWESTHDAIQEDLANTNYGQAEEQLHMLETVAPYITSNNHLTERLVETVQRKAAKERKYANLIDNIVDIAADGHPPLYADRVPRESGDRIKQMIKEAADLYKNLYGSVGLTDIPDLSKPKIVSDLEIEWLVIEEKMALSNAIQAVVHCSFARLYERSCQLTERVQSRRDKIGDIEMRDFDKLINVLSEYPDFGVALRKIKRYEKKIEAINLSHFASPEKINKTINSLHMLADTNLLKSEEVKSKLDKIKSKKDKSFFVRTLSFGKMIKMTILFFLESLVLSSIFALALAFVFGSALTFVLSIFFSGSFIFMHVFILTAVILFFVIFNYFFWGFDNYLN
jgi:signal recognition particle receptor subunit beta